MFRALEHELKLKPLTSSKGPTTYTDLRKMAATMLRTKKEELEPFVDCEEGYDSYCQKVEKTAEWGGEIELRVLAEALERPIVVHGGLEVADLTFGEQFDKDVTLHITFHKHYLSSGAHYNATNPISVE
eukprot:Selendium_serpulae@DN5777_c0_g1_i2.p4